MDFLSGVGYLSSSSLTNQNIGAPLDNDLPTMQSVYSSDGVRKANQNELLRATAMWDAAKSPLESGIVPRPAYADMFSAPLSDVNNSSEPIMSLTGEQMKPEEFTHKNMQPFFGGFMRQNVAASANSSLLEAYTGSGGDLQHKKEVASLFSPQQGVNNVCGMKSANDFYISRIQDPVLKNNSFPIEQIRVGPGLDSGYTNKPSGGFQQSNTRDYTMPPSIDELRTLTNQKQVFESRPIAPAGAIAVERGMLPNLSKNRAETAFEQTPDQWFKTTGAVLGKTERPQQVIKPTARVEYSDITYIGASKSTDRVGSAAGDDYGKASVQVYGNERDTTQTQTVVSNVTSFIKAIVAPFTDIMKHGLKDYTMESARAFGSMSAQIPKKSTLYDSVNHVTRTTIKEQNIHDGVIGNLTKAVPDGYSAIQDEAKTTGRETVEAIDSVRNVGSSKYQVYVYDADNVAKTTWRETTEDAARPEGNIGGATERAAGAYTVIPITVYATQKQFVSDNDRYGNAGSVGDFRQPDQNAAYNMESDGTREAIEITERVPTPQGAKNAPVKESVFMKTNRAVSESLAPRLSTAAPHRPNNAYTLVADACTETKPSTRLVQCGNDRINPDLLTAFKSNPYTHSLASVA